MKANTQLPVFSNAEKLIQLDFDFIFPPPSKSFILGQASINLIHIFRAFVASWKNGFLRRQVDPDNLLTSHIHAIVTI